MPPVITPQIHEDVIVKPQHVPYMQHRVLSSKKQEKIESYSCFVIGIVGTDTYQEGKLILENIARMYSDKIELSLIPMTELEYLEYLLSIQKISQKITVSNFPKCLVVIVKNCESEIKTSPKHFFTTDSAAEIISESNASQLHSIVQNDKNRPRIRVLRKADVIKWGGKEEILNVNEICAFLRKVGIAIPEMNFTVETTTEAELNSFLKSLNHTIVFMNIKIGNENPERLLIELFDDICPKTVNRFVSFIKGVQLNGEILKYTGTAFTRLLSNGWFQSDEIRTNAGLLAEVPTLEDENFIVSHSHRGVLSMVNHGPHTNKSAFMFMLQSMIHDHDHNEEDDEFCETFFNRRYVAFGRVIFGENVLAKLEQVPTIYEKFVLPVVITECEIYLERE